MKTRLLATTGAALSLSLLLASPAQADNQAKNIIFFLGDGMGTATVTAARVYQYGEDGKLQMERLRRTALVHTYSRDALTTDSAPSMSAYMAGLKMDNEVLSTGGDSVGYSADGLKPDGSGSKPEPAVTILELAKAANKSTGVVTTTSVTHATPAATYAHITNRNLEDAIAGQLIPRASADPVGTSLAAAYNTALDRGPSPGVDVVLGGGKQFFDPVVGTPPSSRSRQSLDLLEAARAANYQVVLDATSLGAVDANGTTKLLGLFAPNLMSYEVDRARTNEPSLAQMTGKALDILSKNSKGFFLMVEGGRIDHGLHASNAHSALGDTIAFDEAIRVALDRAAAGTSGFSLQDTLIVVTADHDHTMAINGYSARVGKTDLASGKPGILGVVRNVLDPSRADTDADNLPYPILGFGNGWYRPKTRSIDDLLSWNASTANPEDLRAFGAEAGVAPSGDCPSVSYQDSTKDGGLTSVRSCTHLRGYRPPVAVQKGPGGETHGGADVMLLADGADAELFKGSIDNTHVFALLKRAFKDLSK